MNKKVSRKLAALLRDAGYTNIPLKVYDAEDENDNTLYPYGEVFSGDNELYAPTIADAVYWIYSKYDIWISLIPDSSSGHKLLDRKFSVSIFRFNMNLNVQAEILRKDKNILYFNLPENAFEYAIEYILNTYKPTS